ncbi:MAG TPA: DoxX family protein [Acidimicrobiales bacterium]|nr:DoxX family protein [Acidimicrobiales bacterium]
MTQVPITQFSHSSVISAVLVIARLYLGPMIFAHGYRKFFRGGKIAGTAGWFESIGVRPGKLNALAAASTEIGSGVLLTLGLFTSFAAAGLMSLMLVAIATVHRKNGFFIFNKGEGIEYTLGVAVFALVVGTMGAGRYSLDHLWSVLGWSTTTNFWVTLVLGVGAALGQMALFYRPSRSS